MKRLRPLPWRFAVLACVVVAAGAPAHPAAPSSVAVGPGGTMYFNDREAFAILRREPDGTISRIFHADRRLRSPLRALTSLACDPDGVLYAADRAASDVFRVEPGKPPRPLTGGALEIPTALALSAGGELFVSDQKLGIVARVPRDGGPPVILARVDVPRGLAFVPPRELVVLSLGADQVVRVGKDGAVRALVKGRPFRSPIAIIPRAPSGLLVSDNYSATIWAVSSEGKVEAWVKGLPLVRPEGLASDAEGRVYVADPGAHQVFRVAPGKTEPLLSEVEREP